MLCFFAYFLMYSAVCSDGSDRLLLRLFIGFGISRLFQVTLNEGPYICGGLGVVVLAGMFGSSMLNISVLVVFGSSRLDILVLGIMILVGFGV